MPRKAFSGTWQRDTGEAGGLEGSIGSSILKALHFSSSFVIYFLLHDGSPQELYILIISVLYP